MAVEPWIRFGVIVIESMVGSVSVPAPVSGNHVATVPTVQRGSFTLPFVSPSMIVAPSRPRTVFTRRNGMNLVADSCLNSHPTTSANR